MISALAAGATQVVCPRPGAAAPDAPAQVVFFWSSPGQSDDARPLLTAIERAADDSGARVLDLSPRVAPPDTASRVTRAVTAYDAMRFADAISELDAAAVTAAENGARGLGRDALVDLFLYRALARTESGDSTGAWSDFVRAATLDPTRVLDPARFRPSAVKSFARAVREVTARSPVELAVRSPAGSRVHIDGRPSGGDQISEALLPGEHYVWVERPDSPPFARTVTLAVASTLVVPDGAAGPPADAELRRRAARLGAGAALVVAMSRQDGIGTVELRSLEAGGARPRGAVVLGPSPEANARDLRRIATHALREQVAASRSGAVLLTTGSPPARRDEPRWYQNRWLWLAAGAAAGALIAASPFLLDSSEQPGPPSNDAALDTGPLE